MQLRMVVPASAGEDDQDVAEWAAALLTEVSGVAGAAAAPAHAEAPVGAKGVATKAGHLVAKVGASGARSVLEAVRTFVSRTERTVEVSIDGDVLRLTGVSAEVQERLIEAWLARHPGA